MILKLLRCPVLTLSVRCKVLPMQLESSEGAGREPAQTKSHDLDAKSHDPDAISREAAAKIREARLRVSELSPPPRLTLFCPDPRARRVVMGTCRRARGCRVTCSVLHRLIRPTVAATAPSFLSTAPPNGP